MTLATVRPASVNIKVRSAGVPATRVAIKAPALVHMGCKTI
jgi:hypothetical protein